MGITNQAEIFKQQRKSSYMGIVSKLKVARDSLDIQAFKNLSEEESAVAMDVATQLTALISQVNDIIKNGGARS